MTRISPRRQHDYDTAGEDAKEGVVRITLREGLGRVWEPGTGNSDSRRLEESRYFFFFHDFLIYFSSFFFKKNPASSRPSVYYVEFGYIDGCCFSFSSFIHLTFLSCISVSVSSSLLFSCMLVGWDSRE